MKLTIPILGIFLVGSGAVPAAEDAPEGANLNKAPYRVVARFTVGGEATPGDLCVDSAARRLYVARGGEVDILDLDSGEKLGAVAPTQGAGGLAIAPEAKHGFAGNGDDTITMFDLDSGKVLKTVKSPGEGVGSIVYDPYTRRIFVANRKSGNVAVLDGASGEVVATVSVGGKLGAMSSNGYARLFVISDDGEVLHVIDTRSMQLLGDFPTGPGEKLDKPQGLFADGVWGQVLVKCGDGGLATVDARLGGLLGKKLSLGGSGAAGITAERDAVDSEAFHHGRAYVATADGTLTVLDMRGFGYHLFQKLPTESGAHALDFDSKTHRIFISAPSQVLVVGR